MVTSTSGISALTGGNCTREEHDAYQRHEAAWRAEGWRPWYEEEQTMNEVPRNTISDADLVDNGHTGAPTMSEQFISQQQYYDAHATIDPRVNLAAELSSIGKRLDWVLAHAGGKLDAPELHEFCRASRELDDLVDALRR